MNLNKSCLSNQKGITLVAVILITMAVAMVAFGAITLTVKLGEIADKRSKSKRLYVVRDALVRHYKNYQDLPIIDNATGLITYSQVPVAALGLDQNYRLDKWGRYITLYTVQQNDPLDSTVQRSNINAFTVDNIPNQAAVLISNGPNGNLETTVNSSTYQVTSAVSSDDVIVSVNLNEAGRKIALDELEVIRKKLWAYWCEQGQKLPMPGDNGSRYSGSTEVAILKAFLNDYGLSDSYIIDPWLAASSEIKNYHLHPKTVSSDAQDETFGTTDDILLPAINAKCNGLTIPLTRLDFDDPINNPDFTVEGDVVQEIKDGESAVSFNQNSGSGGSIIYYKDHEDYFDFSLSNSFTILCWILTDQSGPMTLVSKMRSDGRGYAVKVDNGKVCLELSDNSSTLKTCGIMDVDDGACHYVAVSYDADNGSVDKRITVYDFNENGTITANKTPDTNQWPLETILNDEPLRLSGYGTPPTELYTGILDELVIYDQVIDQGEIKRVKEEFFGERAPGSQWAFCDICTPAAGPMAGDGSPGNPWQIVGWNNLQDVAAGTSRSDPADSSSNNYRKSDNYILMNDIVFCEGITFTPLDPAGNAADEFLFDGNGKKIEKIVIEDFVSSYVGLFGNLGGFDTVRNLEIVDADVRGNFRVGTIAGQSNGNIESCNVSGTLVGTLYTGGLVGNILGGRVYRCYSTASVTGTSYVGGLAGWHGNGAVISECFSAGSVSGSNYIGGLVGSSRAGSAIYDCYSTANLSGSNYFTYMGGLIGVARVTDLRYCYFAGKISPPVPYFYPLVSGLFGLNNLTFPTACFWDQTLNPTLYPDGNNKSTTDLKTPSTYSAWDSTNVWTIVSGSYPALIGVP